MKGNLFVFDTNTLISASLFKDSFPRRAEKKANLIGKIAASTETYQEFVEVFLRTKFDRYISLETRLNILMDFRKVALFFPVSESISACRDSKDDKFLELAVAINAACIITGDTDLLVFNPFRNIPIITAVEFINRY